MVDRRGNIIYSTTGERERFAVPSEMSVDSALDTADGFRRASESIQDQVLLAEAEADGMPDAETKLEGAQRIRRATELGRYAGQVESLCAPELMARLLTQLGID